MVRPVKIVQKITVAKVGVYKSTIEVIDAITTEQIAFIEREHAKRARPGVAKNTLEEAYEIAREQGYDHVSELATTERELRIEEMTI